MEAAGEGGSYEGCEGSQLPVFWPEMPNTCCKAPFYISRCLKVSVEDLSFSETCCGCRGKWQEAKAQGTVLTLSSERIPVPTGFT